MRRCLWLTGLPGVGKTTLIDELANHLCGVVVIEAEMMRKLFWPELRWSLDDRIENVKRLGRMAAAFVDQGADVIVAAVSPDLEPRRIVRTIIEEQGEFFSLLLECNKPRKKPWEGTEYEQGDHDLILNTSLATPEQTAAHVLRHFFVHTKRQLFIGRWQPFHKGHVTIIDEALKNGPVAIGVRMARRSETDSLSVHGRIKMIRAVFPRSKDVQVFACPDIDSVHVGRDVGYEVHREVPGISGTEERKKLK